MNAVEGILASALGPVPDPLRRSPREQRVQFSLRLFQHLRHSGFALMVTAHEAYWIAARYGITCGTRGDHHTLVSTASVCKRIADAI